MADSLPSQTSIWWSNEISTTGATIQLRANAEAVTTTYSIGYTSQEKLRIRKPAPKLGLQELVQMRQKNARRKR